MKISTSVLSTMVGVPPSVIISPVDTRVVSGPILPTSPTAPGVEVSINLKRRFTYKKKKDGLMERTKVRTRNFPF